jgi:4'-phosphopantetheinyl transferase EntD
MDPMPVFYLTQDHGQVPADISWLAESERVRAAGLRFPKRRGDWLLGRWTAKRAICAYLTQAGKSPPGCGDLEIRSAPDGAPEAFDSGVSAPVSIALSHSGGKGFCVVGPPGQALGCDIELIQARNPEFIEDYLTEEEQSLVTGALSDMRPLWATLIWSAKESTLKCLREGLRREPLQRGMSRSGRALLWLVAGSRPVCADNRRRNTGGRAAGTALLTENLEKPKHQ